MAPPDGPGARGLDDQDGKRMSARAPGTVALAAGRPLSGNGDAKLFASAAFVAFGLILVAQAAGLLGRSLSAHVLFRKTGPHFCGTCPSCRIRRTRLQTPGTSRSATRWRFDAWGSSWTSIPRGGRRQ